MARISSKSRAIQTSVDFAISALEQRVLLSGVTTVPALNSNPGAPVTLYLDFLGDPNDHNTPAYNTDADPSTFSASEISDIQHIWSRVAEKYSPFNINVTTVPTAVVPGKVQKQLIGGKGAWYGSAGGATDRGAFFDGSTSYVFSENPGAVFIVGELCAHEAGHAFGLQHHSTYDANGVRTATYDQGNSLIAPIMGVSYWSQRGIWENGPTDTSATTFQDDLAILSGDINGFGYRPQDHGQDFAHADSLGSTNPGNGTLSLSGSGIIAQTTDADTFKFTASAGSATFSLAVAPDGAMLHGRLELYNASGTLIASAADANSLAQSISVSLPSAGNYYLVAKSYGQYGDLGQYTLSGTVNSGSTSNATFTISGASAVNQSATYTLNLAASDAGHTVSAWSVNWGDGTSSSLAGNATSATHTYSAAGNKSVSAAATDEVGSHVANLLSINVAAFNPTASISGASTVAISNSYTLNLAAAGFGLDTVGSWTVNWGDGVNQTVQGNPSTVAHSFGVAGNYTITASAHDGASSYSTNSVAVNVPSPSFTLSGAAAVNQNASYTIQLSASDAGHTVSAWSINWGDGTTSAPAGNATTATHTYSTAGSHTISGFATDDVTSYSANSITLNVAAFNPTAAISGAANVQVNTSYTLQLAASGFGLDTVGSWTIHWGDGATQSLQGNPASVIHTFATAGNYNITASANDGGSSYNASAVAVSVVTVPTFGVSGAAAVNQSANYTLSLAASDPGHSITGWTINWGDGSTSSVNGNPGSVVHQFATPGNYSISGTATDDASASFNSNALSVNVATFSPAVSISGSGGVNKNTSYVLQLSATGFGIDTPSSWQINWGDGQLQTVASSVTSVSHTFATTANYSITASVSDAGNTYNATPVAVAVVNAPLFAIGGISAINSGTVYNVTLTGSDALHAITGWVIQWGDGTSSNTGGSTTSLSHTYSTAGSYQVTGSAVDDSSAAFLTNSLQLTVVNFSPTATISGSNLVQKDAPYSLSLSATAFGLDTVGNWQINWGDGQTQTLAGTATAATHSYSTIGTRSITAVAVDGSTNYNSNTLNVTVPAAAPQATLAVSDVMVPGTAGLTFSVTYTDEVGINVSSLGSSNLVVRDPRGNLLPVTFFSASTQTDGSPCTATYGLTAPSGAFTFSSDGTYTVQLKAGEVSATDGQTVAAGAVGTFAVSVPNVPTAALSASPITRTRSGVYKFTVVYAGAAPINVASLNSQSLYVTGPNGYAQFARLVTVNSRRNGTPRIATYSVSPVGRSWTASADGTYVITLNPQRVSDVYGYTVTGGVLGTFGVVIPGAHPAAPQVVGGSVSPAGIPLKAAITVALKSPAWTLQDAVSKAA
jgi:plastocyanin